jgi:Uma2 family endonuclease
MESTLLEEEPFVEFEELAQEEDEMPNLVHGELQTELIVTLRSALDKGYRTYAPISFQGMTKRYTPDVVVYPKRTAPRDKASLEYRVEQTPPLLAVEIISPAQTMYDMILKCAEMLESGVEECWIIEPSNETITVCRKDVQFVRHRGEMLEYALCTRVLSVDEIFDVV